MKKYENFCASLKNMKEIYDYDEPYNTVVLTGLVGLYEICFEQSWKMMKEILDSQETTLLITADQVVVHDGVIREKPSTPEEARKFIKGYSESHAATIGSVLVTNVKSGARKEGWDKAEVYFHKIPDEVVESLIEEGDVFYVAGGLLVEHPLTSPLVEAIVGTIDSVMGLPKSLTEKLIKESLEEP